MQLLSPFLAAAAFTQFLLAITCLRRYPSTRIPALLLMLFAPVQFFATVFGETLLSVFRSPSGFDPIGDGFDILLQSICLVVGVVALSSVLCLWVALSIRAPHQRS